MNNDSVQMAALENNLKIMKDSLSVVQIQLKQPSANPVKNVAGNSDDERKLQQKIHF